MKQNGNELAAYVAELSEYLTPFSALSYFREPLPSAVDERLDTAVSDYMTLSPAQRDQIAAALPGTIRSLFGIYGHRAATRALRVKDSDLLLRGLVAAAISNYEVPPGRRVEVGLAVYHHCARRLDLNPADMFALAADYATADLVPLFISFGRRADVTLKQFGWQERQTDEGVLISFGWK